MNCPSGTRAGWRLAAAILLPGLISGASAAAEDFCSVIDNLRAAGVIMEDAALSTQPPSARTAVQIRTRIAASHQTLVAESAEDVALVTAIGTLRQTGERLSQALTASDVVPWRHLGDVAAFRALAGELAEDAECVVIAGGDGGARLAPGADRRGRGASDEGAETGGGDSGHADEGPSGAGTTDMGDHVQGSAAGRDSNAASGWYSTAALVAGIGVMCLGIGGTLYWVIRRKKRRFERLPFAAEARLSDAAGSLRKARFADISQSGAKLMVSETMDPGSAVGIVVGAHSISGRVIWNRDGAIGVEFLQPLADSKFESVLQVAAAASAASA